MGEADRSVGPNALTAGLMTGGDEVAGTMMREAELPVLGGGGEGVVGTMLVPIAFCSGQYKWPRRP